MDSTFDVSDPSDWLRTSLSQLGPVEQALRCQVCKDFFDTPMITSCSHTFCSLCIRRCLTTDGRCPACRTQDQAMKLRLNSTVQELVDTFRIARPELIRTGRNIQSNKDGNGKTRKRKIDFTDMEEDEAEDEEYVDHSLRRRQLRPRDQRLSISLRVDNKHLVGDRKDGDFQPEDGLTACPICGARMKEEAVYPHLDVHSNPASTTTPARQSSSHLNVVASSRRSSKVMERLPQLNYSLLKDTALRKKLSELGIPNGGPKALLIRRHTEWVNLVNSNCDSSKPKTKRELLQDLESWDRTQGRQTLGSCNGTGSASSVMGKDFDGAAWASNHSNNFQALITQARRRVNPTVKVTSSTNNTPDQVLDHSIDNGYLATTPNRTSAESVDQLHDIQSP